MASRNRFEHETATVLDQEFLDRAADNLNNELVLAVDIETPIVETIIRVSDRHTYIGSRFYEARTTFPIIKKTLGQWLHPQLEFSTLEIEVNNVDGRYNQFVQAGSWIGKTVTVRLGLRDVESTYRTIFQGSISPEGGFSQTVTSLKFLARSKYEKLNIEIPDKAVNIDDFPNLEDSFAGLGIPIVAGDWTSSTDTANRPPLPAFPLNTGDPNVNGEDGNTTRGPLQILISDNPMSQIESYWLKRGDDYFEIPATNITPFTDLSGFILSQGFSIGSDTWFYESGDEFYVYGVGLSDQNPVSQARWLLTTYAGVTLNELDLNWEEYANKLDSEGVRSRVWVQESAKLFEYVLSLLEQVQIEAYIEREAFRLKLNSLKASELQSKVTAASFKVNNWDIVKDSFKLSIDEQNFFNKVRGAYNNLPPIGENARRTGFLVDDNSIDETGLELVREVVFPNLYQPDVVQNQLENILILASRGIQVVDCELTWRSLLLDLGDVILVNVQVESIELENVPCLVREVGYDPNGVKMPVRLWVI